MGGTPTTTKGTPTTTKGSPILRFQTTVKILLLGVLSFTSSVIYAEGKTPAHDKSSHFAVSAIGTATMIGGLRSTHPSYELTWRHRVISSVLMLAVGYLKEENDRQASKMPIDRGDMGANLVGVIYGNLILWEF